MHLDSAVLAVHCRVQWLNFVKNTQRYPVALADEFTPVSSAVDSDTAEESGTESDGTSDYDSSSSRASPSTPPPRKRSVGGRGGRGLKRGRPRTARRPNSPPSPLPSGRPSIQVTEVVTCFLQELYWRISLMSGGC